MGFATLPRSRGTSAAARRIDDAARAYQNKRQNLENVRPVAAIGIDQKCDRVLSAPPKMRLIDPKELKIEAAYQRDISSKSLRLIRKIVVGWNWAKFKPPVCAETPDGLFVIDGQHTAIAAATHPEISKIPVMVVEADRVESRAEAFVAHNRDRLTMSPFQVFHAEVAAHEEEANGVLEAVVLAGASIPRSPATKGYSKPGQIVSVGEARSIFRKHGRDFLVRALKIAVRSKVAPIQVTLLRALRMILSEPYFAAAAAMSDEKIAAAITSIKNIEVEAVRFAASSGQGRHRACAILICAALGLSVIGGAA